MAMSTGGGGGVKAEPNVTPLIDVMLVLLIIFMLVTPLINAGFTAQPPEGVNLKAHPEDPADKVLGIDAQGQYYLDKKAIPNASLAQRLQELFGPDVQDRVLYVKADKNLKYQKVLEAIDVAAHNGVRVVGAIADQTPGTQSSVAGDNLSNATKDQPKP